MKQELTEDQVRLVKGLWAKDIWAKEISDRYPHLSEEAVLALCIKLDDEFDQWCLMESKKRNKE